MADAIDVLVVGGGPVGLALGSALGRAGLAVTVLERSGAPDPRPKASHVHGPVLEGLACAGVTEEDLAAGRPMFGARHRHRDRLVAEVDTRVAPGRWPWSLALPQPELETVLEGHARAAGVTIVRGADVVAVDVEAPSVEAVVDGERARFAGTWVVGCDGASSVVREAIGARLRGVTRDGWALADVDLPPTDDPRAEIVTGRGLAMRIPLREGERWVAALPSGAGPEDVPDLVRARDPLAPSPLGVRWSSPFRLHARWASRWRKGRVLLAGDAAHLHAPVGGHGMNTGLTDAADLAWRLVLAVRHGLEDALDGYLRHRRPAARWNVLQAFGAAMALSLPVGALRTPIARLAPRLAPVTIARWTIGADVRVPGTDRASGGTVRAGLRAVDVALEGGGWLLDPTRSAPTLLSRREQPVPAWARWAPLPDEPAVRAVYGDAEALLLRPDGFLVFRGAAIVDLGAARLG